MKVALPLTKPAGRLGGRIGSLSRKQSIGLLVAAILSVAIGYAGYQRVAMNNRAAAPLQTATARNGSLVSTVSSTGSVVAARQAKLSFGATGKLAEMNVAVGTGVKAGQLLARLEQKPLQLKLASSESALKVSQAKLQQLKDGATAEEIESAKASVASALAKYKETAAGPTDTEFQAAQSSVDQAVANLAAAVAKLEQTKAGPTTPDMIALKTAVDQAKSSLASAQVKLDQATKAPYTQSEWITAQGAVDTAKSALTSAKAKLDQTKAGSTVAEIAAQQASVDSAKRSLISAEDDWQAARDGHFSDNNGGSASSSSIQQGYEAAKASYDAAVQKLNQMMAGPLQADLASSQSSYDSAQAGYNNAVAKVEQMKQGSTPVDLAAAQSSYDQAKGSLASAQAKLDQALAGPTTADLQSATAAVEQAKASLATAQGNLTTLQAGAKTSEIESARSALAGAQATLATKANPPKVTDLILAEEQVRQSQIALDQTRLDLQGSTITAPFDGVVSVVTPNVGEQVSGVAITMVDPKSARVDATVDETDVAKLAVGQPAAVTFDSMPDKRLQGKVIAVAPAGTTSQGVVSYLVSVGFDRLDMTLPAGMSASLSIENDRKDNVLIVPNRAVRTQGRNRVVDVLVGEKTETRTVQVGASNDTSTQITSGLQDGDTVVIPITTTRGTSGPGAGPGSVVTKNGVQVGGR